jgi:hypothetical protein
MIWKIRQFGIIKTLIQNFSRIQIVKPALLHIL